jgi:hypothetical protein
MSEEREDEEYEDMMIAERKAKKTFKKNNLRSQTIPNGCHNCDHLVYYDSYEHFDAGCSLADGSKWNMARVEEFNICDKYKKRGARKG